MAFGPPVTITVNATAYVNSLGAIRKPALDRIVALALADTAKSAKVQAAKSISKRTGLRSALVKSRIYHDRVDVGDYEVNVKSSKKPIPLIAFPGTVQTATGVQTKAWGQTQTIRSAFIAKMKNGHTGVYRRIGKARHPIEHLWGPTIGGTFAQPEIQEVVGKVMRERLQKALARRMAAAVRRANK